MRKSRAGSLNGVMGRGALRITLSISISNYSTKSTKQGQELAANARKFTKLFGLTDKLLVNGCRIDHEVTGFISRRNTRFFFHMKNLAAAHPIQRFL